MRINLSAFGLVHRLQDAAHTCSRLWTLLSLDGHVNSESVTSGSNIKGQNPHKEDGQKRDYWSARCPRQTIGSSVVTIMTTGPLDSK
nr:uncharacterized protein LOC129380713 isoform X2 [Dermacentor andersoni]